MAPVRGRERARGLGQGERGQGVKQDQVSCWEVYLEVELHPKQIWKALQSFKLWCGVGAIR